MLLWTIGNILCICIILVFPFTSAVCPVGTLSLDDACFSAAEAKGSYAEGHVTCAQKYADANSLIVRSSEDLARIDLVIGLLSGSFFEDVYLGIRYDPNKKQWLLGDGTQCYWQPITLSETLSEEKCVKLKMGKVVISDCSEKLSVFCQSRDPDSPTTERPTEATTKPSTVLSTTTIKPTTATAKPTTVSTTGSTTAKPTSTAAPSTTTSAEVESTTTQAIQSTTSSSSSSAPCPKDAIDLDHICYIAVDMKASYMGAEKHCYEAYKNGHLYSIRTGGDLSKLDLILAFLLHTDEKIYTGARYQPVLQYWLWPDFNQVHWSPVTLPPSPGKETCSKTQAGKFTVGDCDEQLRFICQFAANGKPIQFETQTTPAPTTTTNGPTSTKPTEASTLDPIKTKPTTEKPAQSTKTPITAPPVIHVVCPHDALLELDNVCYMDSKQRLTYAAGESYCASKYKNGHLLNVRNSHDIEQIPLIVGLTIGGFGEQVYLGPKYDFNKQQWIGSDDYVVKDLKLAPPVVGNECLKHDGSVSYYGPCDEELAIICTIRGGDDSQPITDAPATKPFTKGTSQTTTQSTTSTPITTTHQTFGKCPDDAVDIDHLCYSVSDETADYFTAERYCSTSYKNGHIVQVDSQEELNKIDLTVALLTGSFGESFFIGPRYLADKKIWVWPDMSTVTSTTTSYFKPGKEICLKSENGMIAQGMCSENLLLVCQSHKV